MCRLRREHGLKIHTVMQDVQLHIGSHRAAYLRAEKNRTSPKTVSRLGQ